MIDPQALDSAPQGDSSDPAAFDSGPSNRSSAQVAAEARAAADALTVRRVDFTGTAKKFIDHEARNDRLYLAHHNIFYRYNGKHYDKLSDTAVPDAIRKFLDKCVIRTTDKDGNPTTAKYDVSQRAVNEVMAAVATERRSPEGSTIPCWMTYQLDPQDIVPLRSGLYSIQYGRCYVHTPDFFCTGVSNFDFNHEAEHAMPRWLEFLNEVFPNDPKAHQCLREIMGLLCTYDITFHKIFAFIGAGRSGKGTIMRLLQKLVGDLNMTSSDAQKFSDKWAFANLDGAKVCLFSDMQRISRQRVTALTENFKKVSGADPVAVEDKREKIYTATLSARILIASNEVPRFDDASGIIASRMIPLKFTQSFLGREDRTLDEKLAAELPGIFRWAMEGYRTLKARGRFDLPESSYATRDDIASGASDAIAFVRDHCAEDVNSSVPVDILYQNYRIWCGESGITGFNVMTKQELGTSISAAYPNVMRRKKGPAGQQKYHYFGLRVT